MNYTFKIEYRLTRQFGQADGLSRLPHGFDCSFDETQLASENQVNQLLGKPVTAKDIAEETQKDKLLSQFLKFVQSGWLIHVRNPFFRLYSHRHIELSVANECLFWGLRVIIPTTLRNRVLKSFHSTHMGI